MTPPRHPSRTRRASALLAVLLCTFLCAALVALMLQASTRVAIETVRTRRLSEARRAVLGYTEYVAATLRAELEKPSAPGTPDDAFFQTIAAAIAANPPTAGSLGVDTSRYAVSLDAPTLATVVSAQDTTLPNTTHPSRKTLPGLGQRASLALCERIACSLVLTDKSTGDRLSVRAAGDLLYIKNTFLQHGYYYNGFTSQINSGTQNKFKGGIFSNNPLRIATNDWGGIGYGAAIQIDRIHSPEITLSSLQFGWGAAVPYYNGIYISAGDLGYTPGSPLARLDGKTTYFASKDSPRLAPTNPLDAATAKSDFLPAFLTPADFGRTATDSNYYKNLQEAGLTALAPSDATTNRALIDSRNQDIKTLAGRFNGNFADANTGWQPQYPDTLPKSMQQVPDEQLAALGLVRTDPHVIVDAPRPVDASDTGRGSLAQQQEVEASKFSTKSRFYVLIENPATPGTQPLPPVIFNTPAKAAAYKAEVAGKTDAEKLGVREKYAADILVLPASAANAIEVKRSFYDKAQLRAGAADPVKDLRVSAVDINLGALRDALGTAATPTTLTRADGSAWDPTDPETGWNGVVYVDVTNPKGNAWVARDRTFGGAAAAEYTYATTATDAAGATVSTLKTGSTIPAGYAYSGGPRINAATGAAAADPLAATEETLVAVRVYNAGRVPDLAGHAGYAGPAGCTLATNTAVYTVGHVNADGVRNTDLANNAANNLYADPGASAPDKEPNPVPFAIACDSLTGLAPSHYRDAAGNWDPTSTLLDGGDRFLRNISDTQPQPAGFTDKFHEMNFNIISGGADASLRKAYGNGSLHPAFVINNCCGQNRNGLDTRFRGSKNQVFASRYNRKYYDCFGLSYEKSNDDAYDQRLRESFAHVPPGMPAFRKFALINLRLAANP